MTAMDVRTRLVALGLVSSSVASGSAWVATVGGFTAQVDAPQVTVIDTAGLPPLDVHGGAGVTRPAFQVLVRGVPNSYAVTAAKAEAIWDALHATSWNDDIRVSGANNPIWLGFTPDRNEPQWSLNFTTLRR